MSLTEKEAVQRQYGQHADAYVRSKTHASGDDLARLIEIVEAGTTDDALDIATGGGHVAAALAQRVKRVVASDLTPAMLEAASGFFASKSLTNVETAEADAEALPFPDASFDIVTCRIAPHHFPNPGQFVHEAARVLRPEGHFGLIDTTVPDGDLGLWINAFEKTRDQSHVRSLTKAEWVELVAETGLTIEAIEQFPKRHDFADWTARSGMDIRAREALAKHLLAASPEIRQALQVEHDQNTVVAFTDEKTLFYARKADN